MARTNPYSYVQAKIDLDTKAMASEVLNGFGLSISDAIRMLMQWVANEKRLPFEVKVPNETTMAAIAELEAEGGKSYDSVEVMMKALDENGKDSKKIKRHSSR